MQIIEEVEALGGMTKAIESGMAKLRIEEAATRKQVRRVKYFKCWYDRDVFPFTEASRSVRSTELFLSTFL